VQLCFSARANRHAAALGDERSGARQAQTFARAGHDRNLVGEMEIHRRRSARALPAPIEPYLPPRPVRSFNVQSNGLNVTSNVFRATISRSADSSLGNTNATAARSIGLRLPTLPGALSPYASENSCSCHEKIELIAIFPASRFSSAHWARV